MDVRYGDKVIATIRDGWFRTLTIKCTVTHIAPCGLVRLMPANRSKGAQWAMKSQILSHAE